jgi:hypothetical protein
MAHNSGGSGGGVGNVIINITNKSDGQTTAKVVSKHTDSLGNQVIGMVIEGYRKNTGGLRDIMNAAGRA